MRDLVPQISVLVQINGLLPLHVSGHQYGLSAEIFLHFSRWVFNFNRKFACYPIFHSGKRRLVPTKGTKHTIAKLPTS